MIIISFSMIAIIIIMCSIFSDDPAWRCRPGTAGQRSAPRPFVAATAATTDQHNSDVFVMFVCCVACACVAIVCYVTFALFVV